MRAAVPRYHVAAKTHICGGLAFIDTLFDVEVAPSAFTWHNFVHHQ
jgi:hypothetical protein